MTDITPELRRFYFQIPSANVLECIWAFSLTDAKAKAATEWLPFWNELEWIDPQHITRTIDG
jgi:hypothetical protein